MRSALHSKKTVFYYAVFLMLVVLQYYTSSQKTSASATLLTCINANQPQHLRISKQFSNHWRARKKTQWTRQVISS
jgi:hypothetical protein